MRPFLEVARLKDGRFAVLAIDPTKQVQGSATAFVQSTHDTEEEARAAITQENHRG